MESEPGSCFFTTKFWALLIVISIGASLLMKLLRAVQHLAWSYNTGNFLDGTEATSGAHRVFILFCAGVFGRLWAIVFPRVPIGSYALLGAGAVLAAATLGPTSAIVLVTELMEHLDPIIIPLLLCVTGASVVTRLFESRPIYSGRIPVHLSVEVPAGQPCALELNPINVISAAAPYASVPERLLGLTSGQATLCVIDQAGGRNDFARYGRCLSK